MSEFKKGQIVFIKQSPESYLVGCRGKVVLAFRKRTNHKRFKKGEYQEYLYLDTTCGSMIRRRGRDGYLRELVIPANWVVKIPDGYKPVTASQYLKVGDKYLNYGRLKEIRSIYFPELAGNSSMLYVRRTETRPVKLKLTVTKRTAAKKRTR